MLFQRLYDGRVNPKLEKGDSGCELDPKIISQPLPRVRMKVKCRHKAGGPVHWTVSNPDRRSSITVIESMNKS